MFTFISWNFPSDCPSPDKGLFLVFLKLPLVEDKHKVPLLVPFEKQMGSWKKKKSSD